MDETDQKQIEEEILKNLYCLFFLKAGDHDLIKLSKSEKWDGSVFRKAVDDLRENNRIQPWGGMGRYAITSIGILAAEKITELNPELVADNRYVRDSILKKLKKLREDEGSRSFASIKQLGGEIKVKHLDIGRHLQILQELKYVQEHGTDLVQITSMGLRFIG